MDEISTPVSIRYPFRHRKSNQHRKRRLENGAQKYDPLTKEEVLAYRKEGKSSTEILAIAQEKQAQLAEEKRIADEEAAKNAPKTEAPTACGNSRPAKSAAKANNKNGKNIKRAAVTATRFILCSVQPIHRELFRSSRRAVRKTQYSELPCRFPNGLGWRCLFPLLALLLSKSCFGIIVFLLICFRSFSYTQVFCIPSR